MKTYYNNITFIGEFQKITGLSLGYVTFLKYVKKGYIKPSGIVENGKQKRPIYDPKSLMDFIDSLPKLRKEKKIRLFPLPDAS